jgi:hypothetical protein
MTADIGIQDDRRYWKTFPVPMILFPINPNHFPVPMLREFYG